MNEVSCKAFEILLPALARKGIAPDALVTGTTVAADHLHDKKGRIDWKDYVAIMRNVRPHFTDDEYVELGRSYMRAPSLRFAFVVARLLLSPMDLYRWFSKPKQGVGNQMFTCVVPQHRELSSHVIQLDLTLPEGFEVCWDFFLISSGNMEELPRLFGLPRAKLSLSRIARGARMDIEIPSGKAPALARAWRFMARPFVGRAAAKELQEAHEALVDRFAELESAQMKLDRQATQLRTAHTVNELVQRDVEVERMLHTIATALVDEAGFDWAEIRLGEMDDTPSRTASHGSVEHEPPLYRTLEARGGERVGELAAAPRPGADRAEREALLDFITPALGIALQNALFRTSLEQLVDRRTAELRTARDQLTGTVQKLEEARGARERFFGNVSHEFRTPLTIILLAIGDVARRAGESLDPRAKASLESVNDSARKLLRLVDELLLLAAGQEDKLDIRPEPTNLSALIEGVVAAWKPAADAAGLELTSLVQAGIAAAVDPVALERVTTNLLSNAVKYTPRGGQVQVELADEEDALRLSVLDTGVGISKELANRLFGRFERGADVQRTIEGTGIGLSLVKQMVEAHGGMVRAVARETGGTEMRVLLPAERRLDVDLSAPVLQLVDHVARAPQANAAAPHSVPVGISQGTVLIAEDDVVLAEMIAEVLADEYTVRVANDGEAALALAAKDPPQLLITDIDMPKLDGIELAKRFREVTRDKLAPVLILSAMHSLATRVTGLDAGAVDYVTKPFDPSELKARVRAQFRMRDMAVRLHRAEQLSTLGILTSGLAHELRNPANGVVNAIGPLREMLPSELVTSGGVGTLLEVIEECARQLDTLSRQLLGFRDPGTRLDLRPIEASKLVSSALSICLGALNGVDVRVRIPTDATVVVAPPMMLQVLTNLLENAAHAAGKGGWISVDVDVSENTTCFEITDSGPGVPPEMRRSIFEPFFTTKPPGVGTGLGLPLARDIVVRHRGSLELRERGGRHVFVIALPRRSSDDAPSST